MSKLKVFGKSGESAGEVEVADSLLVLDRGEQAVHDVIVNTLARRRAGTASTLRKGEVAGSNKKPWRQKGTGRARAGLRQSPVWRGGGVAFGPHPRDFSGKLNRKVERLAFRRALSEKVASGDLRVIDGLALPEAKTKALVGLMAALNVKAPALFVVDRMDAKLSLAARNLPRVEIVCAHELNVYQLLRYPVVLATRAALEELKGRLGDGAGGEK